MARAFVAVRLPAAGVAALDDALAPLRAGHPQLRWVRPARWHITLAFLGDLSTPARARGVAAMHRVAVGAPPVEAMITGRLGRFGRRVLWAAVESRGTDGDHDPLGALAGSVRAELTRARVAFDDTPFAAHLTVARARRGAVPSQPGAITAPDLPYRWTIATVALLSSQPAQRDGHYQTIATRSLDGAVPDA